MSFYADMQGIATDLLTEFKQSGIVLKAHSTTGGTPYDPGTTTWTPTAPSGAVARGVTDDLLADTTIQASDLVVTMSADVTPKMADRVTIEGHDHQIVKIMRNPAAGTVVAWRVVVRA